MSELETRYVFLETQVFVTNNFDMRSRIFVRIKELVQEERVNILVSDVGIREVRNRIRKNVEAARPWANRVSKDARILLAIPDSPFTVFDKAFPTEDIVKNLITSFDQFLAETDAEVIEHTEASLTDVLDSYFDIRPPFKEGEKRKEFPDAITLSSLLHWTERNNESVYVISGDTDIERACEDQSSLLYMAKVQHFLDLENSHHEDTNWIKEQIELREAEVISLIASSFEDSSYYLEDEDGDVESVKVKKVNVDDYDLIGVDDFTAEFEVSFSLNLEAEISYSDPEMTIYDREDDRVYSFGNIERSVERDFQETLTITVDIDRVERTIEAISVSGARSRGIKTEDHRWYK